MTKPKPLGPGSYLAGAKDPPLNHGFPCAPRPLSGRVALGCKLGGDDEKRERICTARLTHPNAGTRTLRNDRLERDIVRELSTKNLKEKPSNHRFQVPWVRVLPRVTCLHAHPLLAQSQKAVA